MSSLFTRYYDRLMAPLERKRLSAVRRELLASATGEVLELGSGTGASFPFYRGVRVTALEPSAQMLAASRTKAAEAPVPITLVQGDAERLPFADASFDTVVGTLVLCSIPHPEQAVREILRVLKPGGRLLFLEHVRLQQPALGLLQDILTPVWKHLCDGCHLNRTPAALFAKEGVSLRETGVYGRKLFVVLEGEKHSPNTFEGAPG